ncbi:MAG TPA: AsmA family protein [Burkholderiaceae bacterium]
MAIAALLLILIAAFDWNWLRDPLNAYITRKTHREFTSSDLHVRLGMTPTIRLRNVVFANAPWAGSAPMAKFGVLEFSVSLRDLFDGKILVPRVALTDSDLRFERLPDGRKNWKLSDPSDTSPSRLRISSLSVTRGSAQYIDHSIPFALRIAVSTFDPNARSAASDADAPPVNKRYTTQYAFDGTYRDAKFAGTALTGDVLSFQESGINFPIRGHLDAGTTQLDLEGTVADAAELSAIDVRLRIAGQTLANLYPFLLLPLPASPPYRIQGHLTQRGTRYGFDEIRGQIGSTDVAGSAAYVRQQPRPLLQASLRSDLLNLGDLGPLIGIKTKASPNATPPTQAQTSTRASAQAKDKSDKADRVLPAGLAAAPDERLLPTGKLAGERLKLIDADAELTAKRVKAPDKLDVENVKVQLHLRDAVLTLAPFDVDFAGGRIFSRIVLDGRHPVLAIRTDVRARQLELNRLLPRSPKIVRSQGMLDGHVALSGTGNSIADAAATSQGHVSASLSKGEISNLVDAAAGLNGGKVIRLLLSGDKQIAVRCGAAAFDVQAGQGRSKLFVVDTEQTRIDASGSFDLAHERFDLTIAPQPKHPGILSLRTPVRLFGSFRHPDYELDKKKLALRAGGAVALATVAPLAALIPLIETGPGSDVHCERLLRGDWSRDDRKEAPRVDGPKK